MNVYGKVVVNENMEVKSLYCFRFRTSSLHSSDHKIVNSSNISCSIQEQFTSRNTQLKKKNNLRLLEAQTYASYKLSYVTRWKLEQHIWMHLLVTSS